MTAPGHDVAGHAAVLGRTRLLAGLPPHRLEAMAARGHPRALAAGAVLFAQGDPSDGLAVVLRGRLKVVLPGRDRADLLVRIVGPGDTLGEPTLVDGGRRTATVVALEPAEVLVVPTAVVLEAVQAHPEAQRQLLLSLAGLVRLLSEEYRDLAFLDLPRRVAKLLVSESSGGRVDLDLPQAMLGAMVGGSRQSVNAALGALERRGWIARASGTVLLLDEPALRRFAER